MGRGSGEGDESDEGLQWEVGRGGMRESRNDGVVTVFSAATFQDERRKGGREEGKRGRRRMTESTEEGVIIAFL